MEDKVKLPYISSVVHLYCQQDNILWYSIYVCKVNLTQLTLRTIISREENIPERNLQVTYLPQDNPNSICSKTDADGRRACPSLPAAFHKLLTTGKLGTGFDKVRKTSWGELRRRQTRSTQPKINRYLHPIQGRANPAGSIPPLVNMSNNRVQVPTAGQSQQAHRPQPRLFKDSNFWTTQSSQRKGYAPWNENGKVGW